MLYRDRGVGLVRCTTTTTRRRPGPRRLPRCARLDRSGGRRGRRRRRREPASRSRRAGLDEWIVKHQRRQPAQHRRPGPSRSAAAAEDDQPVADALVVGCLLITLRATPTAATAGRPDEQSNKIAEAAGCATANGADVAQWGWLDNDCQRFRFIPTGDGFVRIENERSGRVLDAAGCGGAGANVQLWDWLGNACQQFRLEPAGHVLLLGIDVRGCRGACRWDFSAQRARLLDRDRAPQRARARRAARRARARRAARARARGAVEPDAAQRRHVHARQPRGRR